MKPGRELDVVIAKKVFGSEVDFLNQLAGWRIDYVAKRRECNDPILSDLGVEGYRLKDYSTNISSAWKVVEKLKYFMVLAPGASCNGSESPNRADTWVVELGLMPDGEGRSVFAEGVSAPHAICLAALKAMDKK